MKKGELYVVERSSSMSAMIVAVVVSLVVAGIGGYLVGAGMNRPDTSAVATVNGEKITRSELHNQLVDLYGKQTLNQMITSRLVAQEAAKAGVTVTEAELEAELEEIKEEVGGDYYFEYLLAQQGLTEDLFKRIYLLDQMLAIKILSKDVTVTEEQMQEYFNANKAEFDERKATARHILVETEEEARAIKAELEGGADFAELARERSIEQAAKETGGDLGTFGRGEMVAEFDEAVFSMQKGQISDPVQTEHGWHIIELLDMEGEPPVYENVKEKVRQALVEQEASSRIATWIADVRAKAEIHNSLTGE